MSALVCPVWAELRNRPCCGPPWPSCAAELTGPFVLLHFIRALGTYAGQTNGTYLGFKSLILLR
jgi:hypothetical protein